MERVFGNKLIMALCVFFASISLPAIGRADYQGNDCCDMPGFGLVRCVADGAVSIVEEVVDVITPCCCDDDCEDEENCDCQESHDE